MNIKQTILRNWNFMRLLRLGLGMAIIVQSIIAVDWLMITLGLLFTAMPVFNIGCCGTAGCSTPVKKPSENKQDIRYEEVV